MLRFSFDRKQRIRRFGLTLLELIVALGILAVLSTIAIRSLDPLADQARYEATQRLLDDLRSATVGDPNAKQLGGQRIVSGYVADTGSLPSTLSDFTTKPAGLIAYAAQTFDSDRDTVDDVSLSSGWKGPYVRFGAGQSVIVDGWGRTPLIDPDGGDFDFTSQGSDGDSVLPEDDYQADISVAMPSVEYTASVVFRVFAIDGTTGTRIDPAPAGLEQLGVLLYTVNGNGGTTGAIEETTLPVAATGTFEVSKNNAMHGVAAARAFMWSDTDADDQLDAGEAVVVSSYVHYFTIVGGIDSRVEMELR
ncbi:MAG: prepilin-type N-terminal cleavage/methylation domain-containing protein [Planctomycetales bacterium]|nr:prepilin-type N-terminal cleavage/methylation domain-containing protein [Planctomycetales bacterium]